MRNTLFLIGSFVLAVSMSQQAQAQWSNDGYGDAVRCESRDGRVSRCAVYSDGEIRIIRQLSSTPCIRGRNWGSDDRGIWVNAGCRADFRVDRYGYDYYGDDDDYYGNAYGSFRCESRDHRVTRCSSYGGRAILIRQLSGIRCIRGRNWGADNRGVWVSNGCRGVFRIDNNYSYWGNHNNWNGNGWNNDGSNYYGWNGNGWNNNYGYGYGNSSYRSDLTRCESRDQRSRTCHVSVGRHSEVRLLRQLSDTPCIEGQTWGRSQNGVWVTRGCRAEFVVARRGSPVRPPGDLGNVRPPGDVGNLRPPGDLGDVRPSDDRSQHRPPDRSRNADNVPQTRPGVVNVPPSIDPPGVVRFEDDAREDRVVQREDSRAQIRPRPAVRVPEPGRVTEEPGNSSPPPRPPASPRPVQVGDNGPASRPGVFEPAPEAPASVPAPRPGPPSEESERQTP